MITLQGKGVSAGIAMGPLVFFERSTFVVEKKLINDTKGEIERFHAARRTAGDQLDELSQTMAEKIGKENALLFEIHRMMLEDTDYYEPIVKAIETLSVCAEYAVQETGRQLAKDFAEMEDVYMRERAADVDDVSKRVIAILAGTQQTGTEGKEPVVLASNDFSPSETAQFNREKVLALVCQQGAANSHTAIFARTMGIPAIIGLGASLAPGLANKPVALDGETGTLYIDPTPEVREALKQKQEQLVKDRQSLEQFRGKPTLTKSGQKIKLFANIGSVTDVDAVLANDAEGIGLFRSEFL
jgi:phosphotransferase system enzyme I (PtsI)